VGNSCGMKVCGALDTAYSMVGGVSRVMTFTGHEEIACVVEGWWWMVHARKRPPFALE